MFKRASKIFQQTRALLWKNILLMWRMKTESFQEWISLAIFLLIIQISSTMIFHYPRQEIPYDFLGRLDDPAFNATGVTLAYTPVTNTTRRIMSKVASDSAVTEVEDEKKLETRGIVEEDIIGVVFKDDFSYHLRFQSYSVLSSNDAFEHIENQINEMKSISGIRLKSPLIKPVYKLDYIWFIIYIILCFSPYMYFLSVKVIREKKKLKVLMRAMGLQDIAFWLSWSLLYTVYISIMASLLTLITITEVTHDHNFFEIYFFYFFYGIASVSLLFSLLKQPNIASFVGFVLHIIFGLLGFLTLFEKLPQSLEWILNLFSPFAFAAELYPFFNLYIILSLDSVLYLLLAIYFDKVLPGKYGVPHPPSFFLRPSYWFKPRSGYVGLRAGSESSHDPISSNNTEPMPPGFDGKEAIRLNNIKKIYKKKGKRTEALRGLSLNIYEGQITALLGHSGSGKTALLNVLSGFSKTSAGSAMIYNYKVSELWDMEEIRAMVGICPQFNLHFEALTVKENLRTFAHIKGIQPKEVEQEVQKVLAMLDLTNLQDVHADTLSGGQKRKLSLGIAILGNPQVLLLDEPMAGLDPCSRHHVWSLLKERQAGRVTLFTTQSMEEADAHADRKAFLSNGTLQCVGSSLYLKRKWGIGYHLRIRINDLCDPELTSSLVRQYIPDAVLKGQKQGELCYTLPLENTDSFPGKKSLFSLLQGVVNYEVSRTTLEDVFLKLEGEEAINQEGKTLTPICECEDRDLEEWDQSHLAFSEQERVAVSGMALWRQQVCAVMRIRFLKLKHDGKFLRSIYRFTVMCSAEPVNCFPVLVNILSNTFLRLFNSTARIRVWTEPFYSVSVLNDVLGSSKSALFSHLLLQLQARTQLRLAGLFPSAYWCGQALVDIPLFWTLLFSYIHTHLLVVDISLSLQIICVTGYGVSLVLLVYLIAFKFRMGRSNRYIWSSIFILVSEVNLHSEVSDLHILPLEPYIHCVIFAFLLRCLEMRGEEAVTRLDPIFRCVLGSRRALRVTVIPACGVGSKVLLTKIIINSSYIFVPGEVLGLIGPNGAGKSTTINMISGDITVTAGEVGDSFGACIPGCLGCCPQRDPLWPDLTVHQHLEAYTAVRGMSKEDAAVSISCIEKALDLQKHLKTPARRLSAGEARKLCFALSVLGDPTVMLWDEPSVGMDLKGQRRMWKVIQTAMKSKERAAILSTQYLEEVAAMCDRVAILGSGQLRYIGSLEDLKSKFGTSYHLEVKMMDMGQSDALHAEILHLFPCAARQERTSSLLVYKIPMEDALPLSQSFSKLETGKRKQSIKLEEYSLSLHTLQQVLIIIWSQNKMLG
uniref:ABC transporter domain-containing protein n=1 Tax=Strix occidentalis caurina TaxID=311401 RepID=A0A8D0F391_STROC